MNNIYNGDNLRQTKTVEDESIKHIYDGMNVVADIGESTNVYLRSGGELVKNTNITENNSKIYFTEHKGDVFKLIQNDEEYTEYKYDPFGEITNGAPLTDSPFTYCGEYTDAETELVYLRNRYYDPRIGRFISEDLIKDGLNWYAYCENDPINFIDYTGLKKKGELIYQGGNYDKLDAKIIQMHLNDLGYTDMYGNALYTDGIIGDKTTYAIEEFQRENRLDIDGIVGDNTWNEMGLILNTDITERLYNTVIKKMIEHSGGYSLDFSGNHVQNLGCFYTLVSNKSPLDLKQYEDWQSAYFVFDGNIYRSDAPGNIAYGIAGDILKIPKDILLMGAGYAQVSAGTSKKDWEKYYGDNPYDQFCIMVGINYNRRRNLLK